MFTTPRLTLRAFRDGDDENMLSITNNASAAPFITVDYVVPRGPKQKQVIAEMAANSMMFCIIEERLPEDSTNPGTQQNITAASPKFIGAVAFMNKPDARNRRGEFGISMLPEFWGKGYGEEASRFMIGYGFRQLGLHRVSLGVFEWNTRAVELYKRLGFVEEGRARKSQWFDGEWKDTISMGILEDEWATIEAGNAAA